MSSEVLVESLYRYAFHSQALDMSITDLTSMLDSMNNHQFFKRGHFFPHLCFHCQSNQPKNSSIDKMSHNNLPLPLDALIQSHEDPLIPDSYNASELADMVANFCALYALRIPTERQRLAMRKYQEDSSDIYSFISTRHSTESTLKAWLILLDDLFFFGTLKRRVTLNLHLESLVRFQSEV
jgi:hypothetical protein